jgi:hypothetical protein
MVGTLNDEPVNRYFTTFQDISTNCPHGSLHRNSVGSRWVWRLLFLFHFFFLSELFGDESTPICFYGWDAWLSGLTEV